MIKRFKRRSSNANAYQVTKDLFNLIHELASLVRVTPFHMYRERWFERVNRDFYNLEKLGVSADHMSRFSINSSNGLGMRIGSSLLVVKKDDWVVVDNHGDISILSSEDFSNLYEACEEVESEC